MSAAYCYYCLEPIHVDEEDLDEPCPKHGDEIVYGQNRCCYLRGYRDAQEGKEENI